MWIHWLKTTIVIVGLIVTPCKGIKARVELSKGKCDSGPSRCDAHHPYRSVNGSCNNIKHPIWGMSLTAYGRLTENRYADHISAFPKSISGKDLPGARVVSNAMNPIGDDLDEEYTLGLMVGQVVAHDLSLTAGQLQIGIPTTVECCTDDGKLGKDIDNPRCATIIIPPDDPFYQDSGIECISFERTATTLNRGCTSQNKPAEPLSSVTAYADLSPVYGSDEAQARSLRTNKTGLMKTVMRHGQRWPPQADVSLCNTVTPDDPCYQAGDIRVNQNPELTSNQITLLRKHNILAAMLSQINKNWDDEKLYQEARRLNIAMYQHIVYNEYVPRLIGFKYAKERKVRYPTARSCIDDYNPTTEASVVVEFAAAAFRAPHSQIAGVIQFINARRRVVDEHHLSDVINTPRILELNSDNSPRRDKCYLNYDYVMLGMTDQPAEKTDKYFNAEIKQHLFKDENGTGVDLRAIDIQRDRDHGVGSYIEARKKCNLTIPKSFNDLLKIMPKKNVNILQRTYKYVEDIDLSVGGLAENRVDDSLVGPTFRCILALQFHRTRVGDRFFYENCESTSFTKDQLKEIRKASFACLICETSYCIDRIQPDAFDLVGEGNELTDCEELCRLDLSAWRDGQGSHGHNGHGCQHSHR